MQISMFHQHMGTNHCGIKETEKKKKKKECQ